MPILIIEIVDSIFSTSFVAVPAFSRVEPVIISGPDDWDNADIHKFTQLIGGVTAAEEDCLRAAFVRLFQGADDVRGVPAASNANEDISIGNAALADCLRSHFGFILRGFHGAPQGAVATGDNPLHHVGMGAERRGAFGGIQNAKPAARPGADVEKPSSLLEGVRDELDTFGN